MDFHTISINQNIPNRTIGPRDLPHLGTLGGFGKIGFLHLADEVLDEEQLSFPLVGKLQSQNLCLITPIPRLGPHNPAGKLNC
ncbi:MAG: hypothetical protein V3V44_04830, partial [Anaerolineales bacterium]